MLDKMPSIFASVFTVSVVFAHLCAGHDYPVCEVDAEMRPCGSQCEPTCENPEQRFCTPADKESCEDECRCLDGFVRNKETGQCCSIEHCPKRKRPEGCSAHEHLTLCGRNCEPTCSNPNPDITSCSRMKCTRHTLACRCVDDHVRNPLTGECCRLEDCPAIKPQPQCSANEHFALCGRNCEPTCKNPHPDSESCPKEECTNRTEACRCVDGHVRNTLTGKCCRLEDCPAIKPQPQCSANEHFALCGRNCEPTCKNPHPDSESCPKEECTNRTEACRCVDGHVRNTLTGECCKVEDCPVVKPQPQCSVNEHLALCGRNCEPTCKNPNTDSMPCSKDKCTKHTEACRCMDGHVRNTETGQCVKVDECPKPPPKCSPNELLALCGRNCEPTCKNPDADAICFSEENCSKHTEACRCMHGHVRNTETGLCVKVDECPKPPPTCSPNEHLALCGRNCEPTCKNPNANSMFCPKEKCNKNTEACRCMDGHVRNTETGQCVKVSECPKPPRRCSPNEHLALCGRNCEPTCKNPKPDSISCPSKECGNQTEACRCKDGYVRDTASGECCKVDHCPAVKPPPRCSANEHLALCGRKCEPTCNNLNVDSKSCPITDCSENTQACRCTEGHVRNTLTGECCKIEDCPMVKPPPKCSANEHLALCGRNCEPTCKNQNLNSTSCPKEKCTNHTEACRCMDGHVRNTETGQCVNVDECPKPLPKCSPHEHYALCGRNCEPTCKNQKPDSMSCSSKECTKHTEGCRCTHGYVRSIETGQCVRVDECPKPPSKCAANEHIALCGRNCEPTCENQKSDLVSCPSKECNNQTEACRCMDGNVRNMETGQCVKVDDCPKPPPKCDANEHVALCGRNCEPTCENQKSDLMSCPITECNKHTAACRCIDGHVRNAKTGQCVKVDECPKPPPKCAANEHFALCGRNCEPTCENQKPDLTSCPSKECNNQTEACRCMDGHVRNTETGQCVKVDDCPKPPPKCAANEHFALCGRNCEPTCENQKPDLTSCPSKECNNQTEACRCMDGHVRNTETGQCVKVDDCPKPPPKCAANEHFALCGRNCEPTCENQKSDLMSCPITECNKHTAACRCIDGNVRNAKTGQCVKVDECPKPPPKCSANEHFALCGRNCEPTCENQTSVLMSCPITECNKHTKDCRCIDGHVRNGKTGQCVKFEDCPKLPPKCAANEHFALCGRNCEPTCENQKPDLMSCPSKECNNQTEACRCMDGHVRNTETGQCVKVDACPKPPPKCAANEHFALCGRNCEPTCENQKPDPKSCPSKECNKHTEACRCMDGHLRNTKTGQCVKVVDCPKPPPKCAANEQFALCGRNCEPTCEHQKPHLVSCPSKECNEHTEACRCIDGHVRNAKTGQCVRVDDCPKPPPKCAVNEHFALCGRNCEPTCKNQTLDLMSCPSKECNKHTEACRCMDGHVRNTETGQCVKVIDCPKPPPKCADNEHFAPCGRNCEPTCENQKPLSCPSKECNKHTEACRCMDGHVRNTETGQCVKVDACPKPPPKCAANEHFAVCGRNCEPTCENQKPDPKSCPSKECNKHTEACRCMDGHVRNTKTGQCVRVDDCPKPPPKCAANEHFALCGHNCEPTCKNQTLDLMSCPSKECNKHTEACRCTDRHVRNTETGQCVKVDACPKPPPKCAANEHFAVCGRNCEPTCENQKPDPKSCPSKECNKHTEACRCMDGHVRNTKTGQCVRVDDCPKPPPKCAANEHFALCGHNCEPTCKNQTLDLMSCPSKECNKHTEACRCTDGHVRNTETGQCVKVDACPKPPPKCAANEHLAVCGRNCEPTCENQKLLSCPSKECNKHTEACRCMDGHVRNTKTGQCVTVDDCPKPPPICAANEHFALCGRNCEPTCKNHTLETMSCRRKECNKHTEACRCMDGHVRNTETGQCVKAADCPKPPPKCATNEHFALCGRNCEPTCENNKPDPKSCPSKECNKHTEACRCMDGHVRNTETGQCVKVVDCPKPPPKCAVNELFALCGRNCEPTCENQKLLSCPSKECNKHTEACRCMDGHVRNTKTGQCVRVDDCPKPPPKCAANEHFALCGHNCEPTCKNQTLDLMSCPSKECNKHTEACRCTDGHVRNTETGQCVKVDACPKPPPKCAANEHLAVCGRNCEPTCENQKLLSCPSKECNKHTEACRCMDGHVRNTKTGQCVTVDDCPKPPPICAANEHFALCGRNCEPTCKNHTLETMSCRRKECNKHTEACRCMDGHVRNTETGQCVKAADCPKPPPKCATNEHFALCGRNCEPTCENNKPDPKSCPSKECNKHTEACRCMDGHVRNTETGQCVKVVDCPKPPPKCAVNELFALCGRNCEPTCENQKLLSCPSKECNKHTEACRCMDGHVRNTKTGQCVRVDDCPKLPPKCAANEHFALCGHNCEPTCINQTLDLMSCPSKECNKHTEACRCMDGHVRNTKTGQCVRVDDCPKPPPKCAANEHFALCGHNCEPTCKNQTLDLMSCPSKECNKHTEACRCMDGHVRNTETGQCVKVDACPKPPPKCAANEHLAVCGRNCEPTCENQKPLSCPSKECNKHTETCRCMDGHVRNTETGQCVKVADCPKPPPKCATNEHFALCGRNCEPTCENKKSDPKSCSSKECNKHTEACRCIDGHVRNTKTGQCVKVDDCPKPPPKCAANELFALCGRNCESTCEHQNPELMPCHSKECNKHTEGCRCMDGHVRNTETGECVRVDDCPKPPPKCAANEAFVLCGRTNEPTCENQKPDSMSCTSKECTKGTQACRCVDGLVRNLETGQCVRVDDCPKPPPKCTIANEHFALCGRNCEPTCEHQNPELMPCHTKECNKHTEGCRCMDGHVRNVETGECVRVDDCPKPTPQCASNEHFTLCGRNCEPCCKNPNRNATSCPIKCNKLTEGCRCMDGHVRNVETGECVRVDDCPKPTPQCPANEHFAFCGRHCEPGCRNPHLNKTSCPNITCTQSTQACRCNHGYVRNGQNGQCVKVEHCPAIKPPPKCSANEQFSLCGRYCEPNCKNPHRSLMSCPIISCTQSTQACRCTEGHVRNRKTGECVRAEDCPMEGPPKKCSPNEYFALCGRHCEPTCKSRNLNSTSCPEIPCGQSTQACRCKDGYVRNAVTGECCAVEDCPVLIRPHTCSPNEHFALCGRYCEPNCRNPHRNSLSCPKIACTQSTQACRCLDGFVRNRKTGRCVRVEHCPMIRHHRCSDNEHLALCGRNCEPTCGNPNPNSMSCLRMECTEHTEACRCNRGYVRDSITMKCVLQEECAACRRNEQIGRCGRICEATCNNRDASRCAAVSCAGYGCQCKPGFFRNEETNMCVPVGRCPQECGAGEIFAPCGSLCEATCTNPSLPEMCKNMKCPTRGCRCDLDAGFVLDEDTGTCIQKEECSCKE